MSASLRICVLSGGPSAEREVSLRSGAAVARGLRSSGWSVDEVDPVGRWSIAPGTDVVFVALHGTYGEDGTVQRELEAMGLPPMININWVWSMSGMGISKGCPNSCQEA